MRGGNPVDPLFSATVANELVVSRVQWQTFPVTGLITRTTLHPTRHSGGWADQWGGVSG